MNSRDRRNSQWPAPDNEAAWLCVPDHVPRQLLHERHERGVYREVVPLLVQVRAEYEDRALADRHLDKGRLPVAEAGYGISADRHRPVKPDRLERRRQRRVGPEHRMAHVGDGQRQHRVDRSIGAYARASPRMTGGSRPAFRSAVLGNSSEHSTGVTVTATMREAKIAAR